jgi:hypothetical protein
MSDTTESLYPTEWRMVDAIKEIKCRQLSANQFQLSNEINTITINREGFDLYRDSSLQGQVIFEDWCNRNNVVSKWVSDEES